MSSDRFPNFFIIGAPKCGTTTLFDWLKPHPETYLVAKEPNFFSKDIFDTDKAFGLERTLETYLDRICPPQSKGFLTGEATPKYLYSDAALDALESEKHRIKLIVLLRNPIDLCVSLHNQFMKQGTEAQPDFEKAWRTPNTKDLRGNYQMWGRFGERLERVFELFDRDQVLVLVMEEDLKKTPKKTYQCVLKFLEISEDFEPALERSNEASHARFIWLNSMLGRTRRFLRKKGLNLGGTGVFSVIAKFNRKKGRRQEIDANLRREMADYFRPDVELAAKLLSREDLPWPDFFEKKVK